MAILLAQGGTSLYKIDPDTGTATALSLPSGITLATDRRPRFAILGQTVVMTNSPSRNLAIDPEGTVRVLVPRAPTSPPKVAAGSGTGLTGAYMVRQSFVVEDTAGNLLAESALSPASPALTVANKDLILSLVAISEDTITKRRFYRTIAGGTTFFQWVDLDGNTASSIQSGLTDASLATLPAIPSILTPPPGTIPGSRLKLLVSWKNRLWGVSDDPDDIDQVVYTEDGKPYAWPNSLVAYPKGQDQLGIVGFAARKDQLGILKRNGVWQVTGTSNSNFSVVQLTFDKAGCIAPDSILVINDRAYWLGKDGVYEWSADGIVNISDETVKPWFAKDSTVFATGQFGNAFAKYNEARGTYDLHLAAFGDTTATRWVSFNVTTRAWYGPHKTATFTPSTGYRGEDSNGVPKVFVGGTDGKVYTANNTTRTDGTSDAIDFDCYGPYHHGNAPDIMHYFGELSVNSKIESDGTLTLTPDIIGRTAAAVTGSAISHDLTKGHEVLRRIGDGRMFRLRLRENTAAKPVTVYGYEVPMHEIGRR